jgi:hypothetical protein
MENDFGLIRSEDIAAAAAYHREAARLASLDQILADPAAIERHALLTGKARDASVASLVTERANSLTKLLDQFVHTPTDRITDSPGWLGDVLDAIARQLAYGWWTLDVPGISPQGCLRRAAPGCSGELYPSIGATANGITSFGGAVSYDRGAGPEDELYWECHWANIVLFPPAPKDGYLSYRFGIESRVLASFASALSGGIYTWVRYGSSSKSTVAPTKWKDSLAVNVRLPLTPGTPLPLLAPATPLLFDHDVPISGHIQVQKGDEASVPFMAGIIVSLASGAVVLDPNGSWFGIHTPVPFTVPADLGKIEYRFDDSLVWELISDHLFLSDALALPRGTAARTRAPASETTVVRHL